MNNLVSTQPKTLPLPTIYKDKKKRHVSIDEFRELIESCESHLLTLRDCRFHKSKLEWFRDAFLRFQAATSAVCESANEGDLTALELAQDRFGGIVNLNFSLWHEAKELYLEPEVKPSRIEMTRSALKALKESIEDEVREYKKQARISISLQETLLKHSKDKTGFNYRTASTQLVESNFIVGMLDSSINKTIEMIEAQSKELGELMSAQATNGNTHTSR